MAAVTARDWDAVVAGAGPVGTLLAGALARHGASVLVLERAADIPDQTRASTLNARSMEIMSALEVPGLADWPHAQAGHYGGIPVSLEGTDSPWAGLWHKPQPDLVRLLRDWAVASGAEIRVGTALTRADTVPSGVLVGDAAGMTHEARFLVGADGAESTVRRLIGFASAERPATRHMLRCDVRGVAVTPRRFERHDDMVLMAGPISAGTTRLMLFSPRYRETDTPAFPDLALDWLEATGEAIADAECVWLDQFSNGSSATAGWDKDGVFLAGDAAHNQPPVGGSSLNAGLQDAHNLAWKLTAVLGGAPSELATSYGLERTEATMRMQASVLEQEALIFGPDRRRGGDVLERLKRSPAYRRRLAKSVSGLDTHYLGSTQVGPRVSPAQLARVLGRVPLPSEAAALGRTAVIVVSDQADNVRLVVRPDGHAAWVPGRPPVRAADAVTRWLGDFLKPTVMNASTRD